MIQAVAGAGKTTYILNQLNLDDCVALITYTKNNQEQLKNIIIKKFGYYPSNIHVFGLFEFLYSFCYRPLQNRYDNDGICFDQPSFYLKGYHTADGRIFSNQISRFLLKEKIQYIDRIDKFFDHIYIDEVQDLKSDDFDWLMSLEKLTIPVTLVGDFYQSTFSSSRRGKKGNTKQSNFKIYQNTFITNKFHFDKVKLVASHRCSASLSQFVKNKLGIDMESHRIDETSIELVSDLGSIKDLLENDNIIKLFYRNSDKYNFNSDNWGNVKGLTFQNVCVVLNATTFKKYPDQLHTLASTTLSKFYVACTRTKGNLIFIEERKIPIEYIK